MYKQLKNTFLVKSGLAALQRGKNQTPRVLFYHGVSKIHNPLVESLHIEPDMFIRHLNYLQRYYELISMDEFHHRWQQHSFTGKEVTLTFDDGYKNNLTVMAPILQKLGIPFTIFISTRHIDSGERFTTFIGRAIIFCPQLSHIRIPEIGLDTSLSSTWQRKKVFEQISYAVKHSNISKVNRITQQLVEQLPPAEYQQLCDYYQADSLMDWEDVIMLNRKYGCTIGSHCLDHFICNDSQEKEEIERQIVESKNRIEEKTGVSCQYLAYPNGNANQTALAAAEKAGYKFGFVTDYKHISPETSAFCMPRYGVIFDLNTFIAEMSFKPR